jgi:hypothetical protein
MPAMIKPSSKSIDVNAKIIANLDALNAAHLAKKPLCFAKGLPFYTCIDSAKDIYTKETRDGKMELVTCQFDFEKETIIETLIDTTK